MSPSLICKEPGRWLANRYEYEIHHSEWEQVRHLLRIIREKLILTIIVLWSKLADCTSTDRTCERIAAENAQRYIKKPIQNSSYSRWSSRRGPSNWLIWRHEECQDCFENVYSRPEWWRSPRNALVSRCRFKLYDDRVNELLTPTLSVSTVAAGHLVTWMVRIWHVDVSVLSLAWW